MKILVISLAGIGDTLLATATIPELHLQFPNAKIDALVLWKGSGDILEGNRHIHRVLQKDFTRCGKLETFRFLNQLRRDAYDLSINLHPQSRTAYRVIARIIGATNRLSHEYDGCSWLDRKLVTHSIPQDYGLHTVENNLRLIETFGGSRKSILPEVDLSLADQHESFATSFYSATQFAGRLRLGFHVGSGATKNLALKRWPLDHYRQLIQKILERRKDAIALLFGGPQEERDHAWLTSQIQSERLIVAPSPDLKHAAALIQRCHAFVSVDTALMHLAAAVKVPNQIVIEAPTLNKTNEPYLQKYTLVPNPMVNGRNLEYYRYDGRDIQGTEEHLKQCMASVTVERVYEALASVLDRTQ